MSNGEHVTRAELAAELRSLRYEMRLLIVGLVIVLKLNLPDEITVPAVSRSRRCGASSPPTTDRRTL